MNHCFNVEVANIVGIEAAIIFENIEHWVTRDCANKQNIRDGKVWVYNSRAAWCELFTYMGEKQIRNAIDRLLQAELIDRGNYSYGNVNRTYWYTLGEKAKPYMPKGPNLGSGERAKPETNIGTDIGETSSPVFPSIKKASFREHATSTLAEYLEPTGGNPPAEWGEWCHQHLGWDAQRISAEWLDFSNYWLGGNAVRGGRNKDWPAVWRAHCIREAKKRSGGFRAGGTADRGLAAAVRASVANRNRASAGGDGIGGLETAQAAGADAGVPRNPDGSRGIPF